MDLIKNNRGVTCMEIMIGSVMIIFIFSVFMQGLRANQAVALDIRSTNQELKLGSELMKLINFNKDKLRDTVYRDDIFIGSISFERVLETIFGINQDVFNLDNMDYDLIFLEVDTNSYSASADNIKIDGIISTRSGITNNDVVKWLKNIDFKMYHSSNSMNLIGNKKIVVLNVINKDLQPTDNGEGTLYVGLF